MTIQDCSEVRHSSAVPTVGSGVNMDTGGQIIAEEGHVPKIRKPYTITRQRERWTEEEHKRFLEALKLYGRAWRKIEEHVGTKTAVQIRSHAQKFFSKMVRDPSSIEPVEIPPPRPKRKPTHPYPRKLVLPVKKGTALQEQSAKSASLNSSLDQENQSPTSVLYVSDTLGSADSNTLDGSSSPVSTCEDVNPAANMTYEDDPSGQENVSELDEPLSMKLELLPKHEAFDKEDSVEATASSKSLRLFGKILSVAEVENPSTSQHQGEGLASERADTAGSNAENVAIPAIWYNNTCSHSPPAPLPSWAFYGGMSLPVSFIPFNIAGVTKTESQSHQCFSEPTKAQKDLDPVSELNPNANTNSSSGGKCEQGFLPYNRSSSEMETQTQRPTIDEVQRFRLCL